MDENLRETTELPESGGTAPNEENEPETKSIRFAPSAYDPRGIEQWLSERAAEGEAPAPLRRFCDRRAARLPLSPGTRRGR